MGWPSSGKIIGKAVPSAQNQVKFQEDFKRLLTEEKIEYFHSVLSNPPTKKTQGREIKPSGGAYKSGNLLRPSHKQLPSMNYLGTNTRTYPKTLSKTRFQYSKSRYYEVSE